MAQRQSVEQHQREQEQLRLGEAREQAFLAEVLRVSAMDNGRACVLALPLPAAGLRHPQRQRRRGGRPVGAARRCGAQTLDLGFSFSFFVCILLNFVQSLVNLSSLNEI
jgi:hypothetical protein